MAEGRGKAQAEALRKTRAETIARRRRPDGTVEEVPRVCCSESATSVVVSAGELIPADGEVIEGIASVDESAITGESAPVIRESGGDRSAVTGGTRVLSDRDRRAGHAEARRELPRPHDRARRGRVAPEDAERDRARHPPRRADDRSSCSRSSRCSRSRSTRATEQDMIVLVALLVCLIPTTIGALLSAIGIAGMDRLVRRNVLALSGRAVEAAGRLLDAPARQDGHDHARQPPGGGVPAAAGRARAASSPTPRSSRASPTRRPRAARSSSSPRSASGLRERELARRDARAVHGTDADERRRHATGARSGRALPTRSGAGSEQATATIPASSTTLVDSVAVGGGTPLVVAERRARRSGSSTSRTSSRRACASASTSSGRWGSGR